MNRTLFVCLSLLCLALLGLGGGTVASAQTVPQAGKVDPRVRAIPYQEGQLVKVTTAFGVTTHIQFEKAEVVSDVALGDQAAWSISFRDNHLFLKPIAERADTNATIITNKRVYYLALTVLDKPSTKAGNKSSPGGTTWLDPNVMYAVAFTYPDEDKEEASGESKKIPIEQAERELAATARQYVNYDYWVAGSESISPVRARDDGRFIYLTFASYRDLPVVLGVEDNGQEYLLQTVVEGSTIVVLRYARRLMLRRGPEVASVVNRSFDVRRVGTPDSATVSPSIERVYERELGLTPRRSP